MIQWLRFGTPADTVVQINKCSFYCVADICETLVFCTLVPKSGSRSPPKINRLFLEKRPTSSVLPKISSQFKHIVSKTISTTETHESVDLVVGNRPPN